jgi:outer membrane lipoprotein SlyB
MHRVACCVVLMLAVAACSHPSSTTYRETEVGQTIEMAPGSVVSSRIVQVSGEPGYVGAGAGAAVGAVGGATAADGPISLLVGVVGGLVGAGAGYMAEKGLKDRDGIEYVLEMDDGRLVTLVQNREAEEQPLPNGSRVLVQLNGQYTRVIANPAVDYSAGGGGWVDPDRAGAAPAPQAGPGAADAGARHLPGRDVVEQPGEPGPPLTSPSGTGEQQ